MLNLPLGMDEVIDEHEDNTEENYPSWDLSLTEEQAGAKWDTLSADYYTNPLTVPGSSLKPRYLSDSDGRYMFTAASVVTIFGAPQSRKSLLLQKAVADHYGIMIALESSAVGLKKRLNDFNYEVDRTSRYLFPEDKRSILDFVERAKNIAPTIIGIDSFGPLMGKFGGNANEDAAVQQVFNLVLHPLRNVGHCVVILDHITKKSGSATGRDYPIGSQTKLAQVDVALRVDVKGDIYSLHVAKDRDYIYEGRTLGGDNIYGYLELTKDPLRINITSQLSTSVDGKAGYSHQNRQEQIVEALKKSVALVAKPPYGKP
jgi:hypothetical protein